MVILKDCDISATLGLHDKCRSRFVIYPISLIRFHCISFLKINGSRVWGAALVEDVAA